MRTGLSSADYECIVDESTTISHHEMRGVAIRDLPLFGPIRDFDGFSLLGGEPCLRQHRGQK